MLLLPMQANSRRMIARRSSVPDTCTRQIRQMLSFAVVTYSLESNYTHCAKNAICRCDNVRPAATVWGGSDSAGHGLWAMGPVCCASPRNETSGWGCSEYPCAHPQFLTIP